MTTIGFGDRGIIVRKGSWKNVWRIGFGAAAVAAMLYWLICSDTGVSLRRTDIVQLADYLQSFGLYAIAIGACVIFVQTWFPLIPFVVIAGTNVLVFGFWTGLALNYSFTVAAALIAFLFARTVGRDWVVRKTAGNESLQKFNESAASRGFWYILTARLIPVLPSTVVNIGSAVSGVSFRHFAWATLIGQLPIIYMESLIGHDLFFFRHHKERLLWLVFALLLLFGVGLVLRKKWLK